MNHIVSLRQRGAALVFAILLTVALETTIVGSMMNMMRHQREVQRSADQVKASAAGQAVLDRALKLFADYVLSQNGYPNSGAIGDEVSGMNVVEPNKPSAFSTYLQGWFSGFANRNSVVSAISVQSVSVVLKQTPNSTPQPDDLWRRYELKVTIRHAGTGVEASLTEQIMVTAGKLFDFSVFYNEELEITAGPNFTVEGPIFSNKNVYWMNDSGTAPGNTLTLKGPPGGDHPENYVLHSAGNIYFYFKSAIAKNYLLNNAVYRASLPDVYKTDDSNIYPPGDGVQLYAGYVPSVVQILGSNSEYALPPMYYFFRNGARYGAYHKLVVEEPDGSDSAIVYPPGGPSGGYMPWYGVEWPHDVYWTNYTRNGKYTMDQAGGTSYTGILSVSAAFNPSSFPRLAENWDYQAPDSTSPPVNPNWVTAGGISVDNQVLVADRAADPSIFPKSIPVGNSNLDAHTLIEPVDLINDSQDVAEAKFQSKADVNFHCTDASCNAYTVDGANGATLNELVNDEVIKYEDFYNYRLSGCHRTLVIDVDKLLFLLGNNSAGGSDGLVVYVETKQGPFPRNQACPGIGEVPSLVKLINGSKLPSPHGMNLATNGRLWVQGNYNTFDHSVGIQRDCTIAEWDARTCHVAPAALFSDSFGAMSENYVDVSDLDSRDASPTIMNVAVVTGFVPSQFVKKYDCKADMSNCRVWNLPTAWWGCPGSTSENPDGGLNSNGTPIDPVNCSFYKTPGTGLYYFNKQYQPYVNLLATRPDAWNPPWEIPLFVDSSQRGLTTPGVWYPTTQPPAVGPYPGVALEFLTGAFFFGDYLYEQTCSEWRQGCVAGTSSGEGNCIPIQECKHADGSSAYVYGKMLCSAQTCQNELAKGANSVVNCSAPAGPDPAYCRYIPKPAYYHGRYFQLYDTKPSGGLENLINFQEDWAGVPFRFSGVFSAPWHSEELKLTYQSGGQTVEQAAFYGETYYKAPTRIYQYNKDLRSNPAPATPNVFSIKRERWSGK